MGDPSPPLSVYLGRHWHHSHDKIYQAFPLRFCILGVIKNWMVGRPGNKATACSVDLACKTTRPSIGSVQGGRVTVQNCVSMTHRVSSLALFPAGWRKLFFISHWLSSAAIPEWAIPSVYPCSMQWNWSLPQQEDKYGHTQQLCFTVKHGCPHQT